MEKKFDHMVKRSLITAIVFNTGVLFALKKRTGDADHTKPQIFFYIQRCCQQLYLLTAILCCFSYSTTFVSSVYGRNYQQIPANKF